MTVWRDDISNAPRDGTPIVGSWNGRDPRILWQTWFDGHHPYSEPTHWMPIPKIEGAAQ